jgi:hypothetical protein
MNARDLLHWTQNSCFGAFRAVSLLHESWWGHPHQRCIHTYNSIYFDNTSWSYYSRSCLSAYPSSKFTLKLRFIIFGQWTHMHSCFTHEQWIGSKGKRHCAGGIWTAGHTRLVMAATTSYGLHFGRSSTSWKAYQIYFPMDPESPPYLFVVNRNSRFTTESFSATVLRHPILVQRAVYQVSPSQMRPKLEHDPSTLVVVLPLLYNL